jgi:hypothetical protein
MADENTDSNLEDHLPDSESSVPNISRIWDLRSLLKSSQGRLEELISTSPPDHEAIQREQAIIRGVSREIKRLEKEGLYHDHVVLTII